MSTSLFCRLLTFSCIASFKASDLRVRVGEYSFENVIIIISISSKQISKYLNNLTTHIWKWSLMIRKAKQWMRHSELLQWKSMRTGKAILLRMTSLFCYSRARQHGKNMFNFRFYQSLQKFRYFSKEKCCQRSESVAPICLPNNQKQFTGTRAHVIGNDSLYISFNFFKWSWLKLKGSSPKKFWTIFKQIKMNLVQWKGSSPQKILSP